MRRSRRRWRFDRGGVSPSRGRPHHLRADRGPALRRAPVSAVRGKAHSERHSHHRVRWRAVSHDEADRRYEEKEANDSHTFLFIVDSKTVIDAGVTGTMHVSSIIPATRTASRPWRNGAYTSRRSRHRAGRRADIRLPDPTRGRRPGQHRRSVRVPLRFRAVPRHDAVAH